MTAPPLVILHVLAPARFGGLEHVVQTLARAQRARGHDVHVAAVVGAHESDHPFLSSLPASVPVHPVVTKARDYRGEARQVRALCAELRPHILHTHGYRADVVDARAARRLGIPVVSTVHGFTRNGWKNRTYEWLQRRAYRSFDAVVAVSQAQLPELQNAGTPRERLHCIPNAWASAHTFLDRAAARTLLGLGADDYVIGWVGRLGYEKGPDVLVDACAQLTDDVVVSIIGAGALHDSLHARAAANGSAARMRWHGVQPDAGRLFTAFDLFVLSSRTEGTPMVLFEAMAASVPIIAARVGGVPDVLPDGTGYLVPPEDAAALAAAISFACDNRDDANARAAAARRRLAESYGAEQWVEKYDVVYRNIARAARAS